MNMAVFFDAALNKNPVWRIRETFPKCESALQKEIETMLTELYAHQEGFQGCNSWIVDFIPYHETPIAIGRLTWSYGNRKKFATVAELKGWLEQNCSWTRAYQNAKNQAV